MTIQTQTAFAAVPAVSTMTAAVLSLAEGQLLKLDYSVDDEEEEALEAILDAHSALAEKALSMPAHSDAERASQVRILLNHVMPASWLGDDEDLDWEIAMARRLLLKFAGLNPMVDPTAGE